MVPFRAGLGIDPSHEFKSVRWSYTNFCLNLLKWCVNGGSHIYKLWLKNKNICDVLVVVGPTYIICGWKIWRSDIVGCSGSD